MDVRISSHVRELSLSVGKKYSGGVQSLYRSKNLKLSCPCLKRHCDMLESNLSFGLSVKYQFFFIHVQINRVFQLLFLYNY